MSKQKPTTLSRTEAKVATQFITQVDFWLSTHGEKAQTIEITYYPEDDGFEVVNGEENNGVLPRNRATRFRSEILAWASSMLPQITDYDSTKTITAFSCAYREDKFAVLVEVGQVG